MSSISESGAVIDALPLLNRSMTRDGYRSLSETATASKNASESGNPLANGFPDSEAFLDAVAVSLNERYPSLVIERFNKGNASITAPDSLMDDIANRCDALIAAYGH